MSLTFYRVCQSDPPSLRDFVPAKLLQPERPPPSNPQHRELWETGVSVFAKEEQARKKARGWEPRFPLGEYIACLVVPEGTPIIAEKTLSQGHHTLRGDPDTMLACVVSTVPV